MKKRMSAMYALLILALAMLGAATGVQAAGAGNAVDIDGQSYQSVVIGRQVWMKENLNVSRYRNGDRIRYAKTNKEWLDAGAKGEGAWCYYGNDPANAKKYGKMYNYFAVKDPRGLAPSGWHVPTAEEWQSIVKNLGGESVAGGKMKSTEPGAWKYPNHDATNSSNFNAQPGGFRGMTDLEYKFAGENAYFWSSSEFSATQAWCALLHFEHPSVIFTAEEKFEGSSVRCVRDTDMLGKTLKKQSIVRTTPFQKTSRAKA
ncbi:MAG: fibrobacter succinogenes major paralogous domain-containing protein [Chlorobiaceae bacterium]